MLWKIAPDELERDELDGGSLAARMRRGSDLEAHEWDWAERRASVGCLFQLQWANARPSLAS